MQHNSTPSTSRSTVRLNQDGRVRAPNRQAVNAAIGRPHSLLCQREQFRICVEVISKEIAPSQKRRALAEHCAAYLRQLDGESHVLKGVNLSAHNYVWTPTATVGQVSVPDRSSQHLPGAYMSAGSSEMRASKRYAEPVGPPYKRLRVSGDMNKPTSALIVIDMQNDFCLPDRVLCVRGALGCLPKVDQAVQSARSCGLPVFWVCREHDPSGCDIEITRQHFFENGGKGTCVRGTEGAALVTPLSIQPGDHYIPKKRWSAFFQTHLDMVLRRMQVCSVVLAGVQTPNCIRATAFDAVALDYPEVIVLSDATASKTEEVQRSNLSDMTDAGVTCMPVDSWISML